MAENTVKKIATRESYGNSLKELAEEIPQSGRIGCRPGSSYQDRNLP